MACIQFQVVCIGHVVHGEKYEMRAERVIIFGNEATLTMPLISNNDNNGRNAMKISRLEIELNLK